MIKEQNRTLAIFYCQNIPKSSEHDRQELENKFGACIRFFPIPCSGRLEPLHLLRALEEFADAAYVVTCPEGKCRYFEGNIRAKKRVERARLFTESIGLEKERLNIVSVSIGDQKTLAMFSEEIMEQVLKLSASPVHVK